ncbi:MAG: hypothetical protein ACOYK9_01135 [Chlamydiia bacterium]
MGLKQMRLLRILGVLLILGGIGAIGFSNYILSQVHEGEKKVKRTQGAVDLANQALSTNETASMVGGIATNSIQQQINEGKRDISYYQDMAANFSLGGWISIGVGAGLFVFSFTRKKH